jgi:hypothetical protein
MDSRLRVEIQPDNNDDLYETISWGKAKCTHPSCKENSFAFIGIQHCMEHWSWEHQCTNPTCTAKVQYENDLCKEHDPFKKNGNM